MNTRNIFSIRSKMNHPAMADINPIMLIQMPIHAEHIPGLDLLWFSILPNGLLRLKQFRQIAFH